MMRAKILLMVDKVLTDTHTLVWALSTPEMLSSKARKALVEYEVCASVVNLWELVLKMHRKNSLLTDPMKWWSKYITANRIPSLSVQMSHIEALANLDQIHKDPFDRILLAQAVAEGIPLVTKDTHLSQYGVQIIW